jgi:hypothetical protein
MGSDNFKTFAAHQREKLPVFLKVSPHPRIREGFVCLTDPERAEVCLATFQVFRDLSSFQLNRIGMTT